ncbi:MAG: Uma2 family endonuclease [Chloroflexi bacterium]|nr:Uma2 family endonuclease [Chloroflexota bacterium]
MVTTNESSVRFNYQDYCQLPDGERYEIIDGKLLMVKSNGSLHQMVLRNLESMVWPFVREKQLGQVLFGPLDVILSEEDVVQPDLIFVGRERQEIISERGCEGPPDLVMEVTSLASSTLDRQQKRELYARYGVQEYWLVDPVSRSIDQMELKDERLTLKGTYSRKDDLITSEIIPELSVPVQQIFEPA